MLSIIIFRGSNFVIENSSSLSESELLEKNLLLLDELMLLESSLLSRKFSAIRGGGAITLSVVSMGVRGSGMISTGGFHN